MDYLILQGVDFCLIGRDEEGRPDIIGYQRKGDVRVNEAFAFPHKKLLEENVQESFSNASLNRNVQIGREINQNFIPAHEERENLRALLNGAGMTIRTYGSIAGRDDFFFRTDDVNIHLYGEGENVRASIFWKDYRKAEEAMSYVVEVFENQ